MSSGNSAENSLPAATSGDMRRPTKRLLWHAPVLKELDIALTADDRGHHLADGKAGNDKDHS